MTSDNRQNNDPEYALIVQQPGKPQQVLVRYLTLLLNYRYGLDLIVVHHLMEAFSTMQKYRPSIRCAFIVQNRSIDSRTSIAPLSDEGDIPLFLLLPNNLIEEHKALCRRMRNVYFCAWENAFQHAGSSLHQEVSAVFSQWGVGDLFSATMDPSGAKSQQRIEQRLNKIRTLPTIPELALRIVRMAEDTRTTLEDLQQTIMRDPAVVHKMMQVVNSALFAGAAQRESWTLSEAIVRLGRKKIGALVLQVKLMNSLGRPRESEFDLKRFWRHSLACALIADHLCTGNRVSLPQAIPFDAYWIGALLHDIGKLALGFFFWHHFEELVDKMGKTGATFREAEWELGNFANHEFLGKLLLKNSRIDSELVDAVGTHHATGKTCGSLAMLIHLADNVSKELDLGYLSAERVDYNPSVLRTLGLSRETVGALPLSMGDQIIAQVDDLVERCLGKA